MRLLGPGPLLPEPERTCCKQDRRARAPISWYAQGCVHASWDDAAPTWKSVEGLTHAVCVMRGSILTTRCMLPDLWRRDPRGYVYPVRSTSYLYHELGHALLQPITCLWCATDQWRP